MYQIISVCYTARDVEIKVVFDELIRKSTRMGIENQIIESALTGVLHFLN